LTILLHGTRQKTNLDVVDNFMYHRQIVKWKTIILKIKKKFFNGLKTGLKKRKKKVVEMMDMRKNDSFREIKPTSSA